MRAMSPKHSGKKITEIIQYKATWCGIQSHWVYSMKNLSRRTWADEEKLSGTAGRMSYWKQEQVKMRETS